MQGGFRERFEAKGRLSAFVKSIPTKLIVNPDAALLGAARAAEEVTSAAARDVDSAVRRTSVRTRV